MVFSKKNNCIFTFVVAHLLLKLNKPVPDGTGFAIGSSVTMPEKGRATILCHWISAVQNSDNFKYD